MSDSLKYGLIAAVTAVVVALGVGLLVKPSFPQNVLVDTGNSVGLAGATASALSSTVFSHLTNLELTQNLGVVGTFFQGNAHDATVPPLQVNASVGACNTSTSTLFAIQPPSGATSTVTFFTMNGVNARTSDIIVGTSTTPGGMTSTSTLNVTGNGGLFGSAAVPTGSFYMTAGFKVGPGKGYTTLGNGPYGSQLGIVVGPNEYLVGYATSTAVTGGNGVTSCTYKAEWYN